MPKEQLTTPLSNEEYNGFPFSLEESIQNAVNRDERRWYVAEKADLPKYTPSPVLKWSAGVYNFFRSLRP
jgi:hypothetical protein